MFISCFSAGNRRKDPTLHHFSIFTNPVGGRDGDFQILSIAIAVHAKLQTSTKAAQKQGGLLLSPSVMSAETSFLCPECKCSGPSSTTHPLMRHAEKVKQPDDEVKVYDVPSRPEKPTQHLPRRGHSSTSGVRLRASTRR